jgi:hypothetical protein
MPQLQMMITDAGLDALVDAENAVTGPIEIAEMGISDTPFVMAPTLTAVPGQFKLIDTVNGQEIAPNVIHVSAYDTSNDSYDVTGFGFYLTDGTLFAVYSHATQPVLSKAELAFALTAVDVAFTNNAAANIAFGGAMFLYPPASETVQGIARFATQAEVDSVADGPDAYRAVVTDKTLRARLSAFIAGVNVLLTAMANNISALAAKTVTGTGAATGGGAISTNPEINVAQALEADLEGTSNVKVLTPSILGLVRDPATRKAFRIFGFEIKWGSFSIGANTQMGVTFPVSFPGSPWTGGAGQCFAAIAWGSAQDAGDQDNYVHAVAGSQSASGFTAHNGHGAMTGNYIAFGS